MSEASCFSITGIFDGVAENEFTDQKTGRTIKRRSAIFIVDYSDRKRDAVFVRVPDNMATPEFKKGEVYTIPVSVYSKERISFTARADLQPR